VAGLVEGVRGCGGGKEREQQQQDDGHELHDAHERRMGRGALLLLLGLLLLLLLMLAVSKSGSKVRSEDVGLRAAKASTEEHVEDLVGVKVLLVHSRPAKTTYL